MTNIINGTAGSEALSGTADHDSITALGGDDTLTGGAGDDVLDGGDGTDTGVYGGGVQNYAFGVDDSGNLTLTDRVAGDGIDTLVGIERLEFTGKTMTRQELTSGDDTLSGDWLIGGDGRDYLWAAGNDAVILDGGNGQDTLGGGYASDDYLSGGEGNDEIMSFGGNDLLSGGDGNDTFSLSLTDTGGTLSGGNGQDLYRIVTWSGGAGEAPRINGEKLIIDFAAGDGGDVIALDSVLRAPIGYTGEGLASASARLVQAGADVLVQIDADTSGIRPWETVFRLEGVALGDLTAHNFGGYDPSGLPAAPVSVTGTGDYNVLSGGYGNDTMSGDGGGDTLYGYEGRDQLSGDAGDDSLVGGLGFDSLYGGAGDDILYDMDGSNLFDGGDGADQFAVHGHHATVLGGSGDDTINSGAMLSNLIEGGDGDDVVFAFGHATVTLGAGRDLVALNNYMWDALPVITDFQAGDGGDSIDVAGLKFTLNGYGADPFATGHFFWTQDGADAILNMDIDGSTPTFASLPALRLLGVNVADLTAANLTTFTAGGGDDDLVGVMWNDTIDALGGNDRVRGLSGDDSLIGNDGNDILSGNDNSDTLIGGDGNDSLDGGTGYDSLSGGTGDDTLDGGAGGNTLDGGDGLDTAVFAGVRASYRLGLDASGNLTVTDVSGGPAWIDTLSGVEAIEFADKTMTRQEMTEGNDTVTGEWLAGGMGNDRLTAPVNVPSILEGGEGNDVLVGASGADILIGGAGRDILTSGGGGDIMSGGDGDDSFNLTLSNSAATLTGGAGQDTYTINSWSSLTGSGPVINAEKLITDFSAGDGGDIINLQSVVRTLFNYAGDGLAQPSVRLVQWGSDTLVQVDPDANLGRTWETVYRLQNVNMSALTMHNFGGYDPTGLPAAPVITPGTTAADTLTGGLGHDSLSGGDSNDSLTGNDGRDLLAGEGGNDTLTGGLGFDTLLGGAGDDSLNDSIGSNVFDGGDGNDSITVSGEGATITGGLGEDTIRTAISSEGAVIDAGGGADLVWLLSHTNTVVLGDGQDVLSLQNGSRPFSAIPSVADFQAGKSGDSVNVNDQRLTLSNYVAGSDPFASGHYLWAQEGADAVLLKDSDGAAGALSAYAILTLKNVNAADLTAWNVVAPSATNEGETLLGTASQNTPNAADLVDGLGGDDRISGFGGNDTLVGNTGDDTLIGGQGNDVLIGGEGVDTVVLSGRRDDYTVTVSGTNATVTGADGSDQLLGIEWLRFADQTVAPGAAVNIAPELAGDLSAAVNIGNSYVLTAGDLGYSDPDSDAAAITFSVSNVKGGGVFVGGVQVSGFSAADLAAGSVSFRHGGYATTTARFDVSVSDGEDSSGPSTFVFVVNDGNRVLTGFDAGDIELISKTAAGVQADDGTSAYHATPDGRYVVFSSIADNMVADGQEDRLYHHFRKDMVTGDVVRVDVTADGELADQSGWVMGVSDDGNIVLFDTYASNLVDGASSSLIYAKNLATGELTLVSTLPDGTIPSGVYSGGMTSDGQKVFYSASAVNSDGVWQEKIYVRSLVDGTVNVAAAFTGSGTTAYSASFIDVSGDGGKILFVSNTPDLIVGDYNNAADLFLLDTATGNIALVSAPSSGEPSAAPLLSGGVLSRDATKVMFSTNGHLTGTDSGGIKQVFVKDMVTGELTLISVNTSGIAGNNWSETSGFSADGNIAYFWGPASNLVAGDDNGKYDLFAYDLTTDTLTRVVAGNGDSYWPVGITPDLVLFSSDASDLVNADSNGNLDAFLLHVTGNDSLTGGTGNDSISGKGGNDSLSGVGGNDTLVGGIGNDVLNGGSGLDKLYGGVGNDSYYVDQSTDQVFENAGEGSDTVFAALSWKAGTNIEGVTLTGSDNLQGYGNALANILTGNTGNNTLSGAEGADTLNGGAGNDKLDGGIDHDVLNGEAGNDNLLGGEGSDSLDGGAGNDQMNGGARWDTLRGGEGDDILDGGADNDAMYGGTGNDTYVVDHIGDRVYENYGEGTDTVKAGIDFALSPDVEVLYLTGTGNIGGSGNGLSNSLNGNSGNNVLTDGLGNDSLYGWDGNDSLSGGNDHDRLSGGNGADTMIGGHGNDVVGGGAGADDFVFSSVAVNGHDHVTDFQHGLDRLVFKGSDYGFAAGHGLTAAEFTVGSVAVGAGAQFGWDSAAHKLWWDADGNGAGAAFELAIVSGSNVTKDDLFFT